MATNPVQYNVMEILCYFDVFDFPLKREEIIYYSKFQEEEIVPFLNKLVQGNEVFLNQKYYSLKEDYNFIQERKKGVARAKSYANKAKKRAKLIGKFPFVRGVFISGSFSKGVITEDGDIDYFIITKQNRLWIARTLLILFKKLFLFNSRKFFCLNYFITENELEISQKNRFTATELFTLIPVVNSDLYHELLISNNWLEEYYELNKIKKTHTFTFQLNRIQKLTESIAKGKLGEKIDIYLMKKTFKRWEKKFPNMPKFDFDIAFQTNRNVSKHHPSNYQKTVLSNFEKKMKKIS